METDIQMVEKVIAAARNHVPFQNRRKYEIEAAEFFDAIRDAILDGDAERAAELLERWKDREWWLVHSSRCHIAPPCLVRRKGETMEHFNERRLTAWRKI